MSEFSQPFPYTELAVGGELGIEYKESGDEPTKIIIGRNPVTESVDQAVKDADDLQVKISGAGKDISRRALELNIDSNNVVFTNIGRQPTRWRTDPEDEWSELPRGGSYELANSTDNMINFEVQLGDRLLLRAGSVGGKEKALQSLLLR